MILSQKSWQCYGSWDNKQPEKKSHLLNYWWCYNQIMPVARSKAYKSKTNRHKHKNIKQVGELKLGRLHSM